MKQHLNYHELRQLYKQGYNPRKESEAGMCITIFLVCLAALILTVVLTGGVHRI